MSEHSPSAKLLDFEPAQQVFLESVYEGLRKDHKSLPCKFFYDENGSQLFDEICDLDEYYLTRTELSIMATRADEMSEALGSGVMLIEYGSGSSIKTRLLLDHLVDPAAYVPVDISRDHLLKSAETLAELYPHIEILPVCSDFTKDFELPDPSRTPSHRAVYFPGSTIGNFETDKAAAILRRIAPLCGKGGGLLIGIDLQKDPAVIHAAYNDAQGVTAAFNKNLLVRINRELDANFDVDRFEHRAKYSEEAGRVEIGLVSRTEQVVRIGEELFHFDAGEVIHTEYSHKYTIEQFETLAARAGLKLRRTWTDDKKYVAVVHLIVAD